MAAVSGTPGGGVSVQVKYVPNLVGIELATKSPEIIAVLNYLGQQIYDSAKSLAPVDTGAFQDSITLDKGLEPVVYSDIRYAGYLEFGTSDTPTFAVFRRASETARV